MRAICVILGTLLFSLAEGGDIQIFRLEDCEDPVDNPKIIFSPNYDPDIPSCDFSADVNAQVSENDLVHLAVHELMDDALKLNVKEYTGEICDTMERFFPKAWDKVLDSSETEISEYCPLSQGKYNFKNIQLSPDDMDTPDSISGKFKMDASVIQNGQRIGCIGVVLEIE